MLVLKENGGKDTEGTEEKEEESINFKIEALNWKKQKLRPTILQTNLKHSITILYGMLGKGP